MTTPLYIFIIILKMIVMFNKLFSTLFTFVLALGGWSFVSGQCGSIDVSAPTVARFTTNPTELPNVGQNFTINCSDISMGTLDAITIYRDHPSSIPGVISGIQYELTGGSLGAPVTGIVNLTSGANVITFSGVDLSDGSNSFSILFSHPTLEFDLDANSTVDTYPDGTMFLFFSGAPVSVPGDLRFAVAVSFVLPVEYLSFNANIVDEDDVLLKWQTATEINNDGFEVERSNDGENWKELTFVPGYGTSTEVQSYRFKDIEPQKGINYYRLRQEDYDGKVAYSKIVTAQLKSDNDITIAPNPTTGLIALKGLKTNAVLDVEIFDTVGSLIMKSTISKKELDISSLENGIYLIMVNDGTNIYQSKVIKN